MDPANSSPLVAWLASDESQMITGQVIRSIQDRVIWMHGWREGAEVASGQQRWDADEARKGIGHRRLPRGDTGPAVLVATVAAFRGPALRIRECEAQQVDCVLTGDLPDRHRIEVAELLGRGPARIGPRAVRVGIVGLEDDVVDPDLGRATRRPRDP